VTGIQVATLIAVGAAAPVVVLTRDPLRQAISSGIFGLGLTALFFAFKAPDVALSQIVVSTLALPLMVLLALAKIREHEQEEEGEEEESR
jgi:energy-converting hydrogenase B subunit D